MDKATLTLSAPVQAHGETVKVLTFRQPKGEDLAAIGALPFDIVTVEGEAGETAVRINTQAVTKLVARLADVPPSAVRQLSAPDWLAAMTRVLGFFGDLESSLKTLAQPEPSSTAASTSPGSSA